MANGYFAASTGRGGRRMPRAIEIGGGLVTAALVGVALTGWQVPEEWRPWLFVLAVVFGAITIWAASGRRGESGGPGTIATATTKGPNSPAQAAAQSGHGNTQNVAGRDIYVGPPLPTRVARARVRINAMDNGASERGARWFHLRAFTTTSA